MPPTGCVPPETPPVRSQMLPYGRQQIDEDDIAAVVKVLRGPLITTGEVIPAFEAAVAETAGVAHGVALCNGTAALHAAMHCLGIGSGDEVIVPAITFAATANAVVYEGGVPVFADVDPDTLLLNPRDVEQRITPRTKAVIAVDYAGQPCDYDALRQVTDEYGLTLVSDACHALGGSYRNRPVGSQADLSTFSFHPVKPITTGEGGMVVTNDTELADRMRRFRNHGITVDYARRQREGSWFYEIAELGYNYRITDIQCALGLSQLPKLGGWVRRRQAIAERYDQAFAGVASVEPLKRHSHVSHAYHLYVVRVREDHCALTRAEVFKALIIEGIGVNVHYIPVHLHPFYRERFGCGEGDCPVAESVYEQIISLPIFPAMSDEDVADVIEAVNKVVAS